MKFRTPENHTEASFTYLKSKPTVHEKQRRTDLALLRTQKRGLLL